MSTDKIAPSVGALMSAFARGGAEAVMSLAPRSGVVRRSAAAPAASLFVRCDPSASYAGLRAHGIEINQSSGAVRTAFAPLPEINRLAAEPSVTAISGARRLRPKLELAHAAVGLPGFRTSSRLDGSGVIVGVVDTGIDAAHAAFAGRVLRIWDQTAPSASSGPVPYGRELRPPQLAASMDMDGHGTHVAGIAAGAAITHAGKRYEGVAPGAELVVVRTDFDSAHIADAVQYVMDVGEELGRPVVVNLSLGGHYDPHDGTDDLCAFIDGRVGPGRLVVAAAGNEGDDAIHGAVDVPAGRTRTMRFRVPSRMPGASIVTWSRGERVELALRGPRMHRTPFVAQPGVTHRLPGADVYFDVRALPDPHNGDFEALVELRPTGSSLPAGVFRLEVRNREPGDAHVDVWLIDGEGGTDVIFTGPSGKDELKVGSPGAARGAITVGALATCDAWTDVTGASWEAALAVGQVASFSSEGPCRDGRDKPDVLAPGAMVVAARSLGSAPDPGDEVKGVPDGLVVMQGTSMAAPYVSGLLALLLAHDPALDPARARQKLLSVCARSTFDPKEGFGAIDLSRPGLP